MPTNYADASLKIAAHKCCVLYEAASGQVVSGYESISYVGSVASMADEDIERRLRDAYSRLVQVREGRVLDHKSLRALFVPPADYSAIGAKRVDLQTKKLVTEAQPG